MDNFENFQSYIVQNPNCILCSFGRIGAGGGGGVGHEAQYCTMRAILDKCGNRQKAQIGPILTFNKNFLHKIKIQWGYILGKNLHIIY